MAVSSLNYINQFNGDGSTVDFVGNYYIPDTSAVQVITTDTTTGVDTVKTITTDYTVVIAVDSFTVTFGTAPASGTRVTLLTDTPSLQNATYVENDAFPAATTEDALDYLATAVRTLQAQANRTPQAPEGTLMSGFDNTLPPMISDNSGRALIVNEDATGFDLSDIDLTLMGDVTGPAGATDNAIARFNGTTGLLIDDSIVTISDNGAMTFNPYGTGAGEVGEIRLLELAANGTNYVGFKAPDALVDTLIYTMPDTDGTNGQVLSTTGSGNLTWVNPSDPIFDPWNVVTNDATMTVNNGYITDSVSNITLTIPAVCGVGSEFEVAAAGSGGFTIAQSSGQTIRFGTLTTTTGTGGSLQSTEQGDAVRMVCSAANTDFIVISSIGNINII
jgi:hypothetical protein